MSTSAHTTRLHPFVIAEYEHGHIKEIPKDCPWQEPGETCAVRQHDLRVRKTGPPAPLAVLHCASHEHFFTAYPPDFVPYARRALVCGEAQHQAPSLAEVVEGAAQGELWDREAEGGTDRWWSTQLDLLTRVERLFGLECAEWRQAVGLSLGLALSDLDSASRARTVRARGQALHVLIQGLKLDDWLRLGQLTRCWGPVWRWECDRQALVSLWPRGPPKLP